MSAEFFEQVRDALSGALDPAFTDFDGVAHGAGLKVTWGDGDARKEHYETQLVRGTEPGSIALEIGFHSEHAKPERNDALLARLATHERGWRKRLGTEATVGPFLGNDRWRRISETWDDFDLGDPECAFEVADRLAVYIETIEPLRRSS